MLECMILLLEIVSMIATGANSEEPSVGSVQGSKYVQYQPGNTNLIISIPHGGKLKPAHLEDRHAGCREEAGGNCQFDSEEKLRRCPSKNVCKVITGSDIYTQDIAEELVKTFKQITGLQPYVVTAHIHRSKVDLNRNIEDGAQHDSPSIEVYSEYHNFIKKARDSLTGPGLLIDLHGQNHKQNSTELGYLYFTSDLNDMDYSRSSSVSALVERSGVGIEEILFGQDSLGAMLERAGYRAVPSPRQPSPGKDEYYRGGFITQNYGSSNGGGIDAIQIEIPGEIRYGDGVGLRTKFGVSLGGILADFFQTYYQ